MGNETKINPFARILNAVTKVNPSLAGQKEETTAQTVVNSELAQAHEKEVQVQEQLLLEKYSVVKPLDVVSGEADLYLCNYKFRGELYTDTTELVRALASDWENGKKQLYRGLLTGFFMACDPEIAEACMDAEDSVTKRNENEDVAFWKLLYKIAPGMNVFFWKNQKYDSLNSFGTDLMEKLRSGDVDECSVWNEILSYGLISSYMKAHKFSDVQVSGAESIESSARLNKANARTMALNYYLLAYLISGDRTFVLAGEQFNSIDALAEHMNTLLIESFDKFDVFCKNIIGVDNSLDPQFEAWLVAQGKSNEIEQWKKTLL